MWISLWISSYIAAYRVNQIYKMYKPVDNLNDSVSH